MSIKKKIKILLAQEGITLTRLTELINEKFNKEETIQNMSNKFE